jgi:hypothetical protein
MPRRNHDHQREYLSIRLDPPAMQAVMAGAVSAKQKVGSYARTLLLQALDQSRAMREVRSEIQDLRDEISRLRQSLVTAVVALLMVAGKMPQDKATAWARENLLRE